VEELTDINALADEYLPLSYHGLRAKDNSFNATLNTDFDKTISNINIIPQDIGRMLFNLYHYAFNAVNKKKKLNIKSTSHHFQLVQKNQEIRYPIALVIIVRALP